MVNLDQLEEAANFLDKMSRIKDNSRLLKIENNIGMWRSLVAHLTGGQGAGGSNPLIPTNNIKHLGYFI